MTFIVAGLVGLCWLLFWVPLYDEPKRQKRLSAEELAYIESDRDEGHGNGEGYREPGRTLPW
jgi:MFS transporter, ACS family, hexuronate transporter